MAETFAFHGGTRQIFTFGNVFAVFLKGNGLKGLNTPDVDHGQDALLDKAQGADHLGDALTRQILERTSLDDIDQLILHIIEKILKFRVARGHGFGPADHFFDLVRRTHDGIRCFLGRGNDGFQLEVSGIDGVVGRERMLE